MKEQTMGKIINQKKKKTNKSTNKFFQRNMMFEFFQPQNFMDFPTKNPIFYHCSQHGKRKY